MRIDIPNEVISTDVVFKDDSAATSAVRGIYSYLHAGTVPLRAAIIPVVGYIAGLSSDEFIWALDFLDASFQTIDENQASADDLYLTRDLELLL